ncbi:hypothetical protein [Kitasatospora sp. MAP5-34]|uniref:hypothetical protein n=1 Tax=Kitasatospora sp. MAP5-34 TaxID=3035102 RepID=UPI0024749CA0|nr:hypothetical protein [Kitasatospora sp. MAP5-34]MDH6576236.1 hypothetical protein [Kitasatospora sp. MAP5-34]
MGDAVAVLHRHVTATPAAPSVLRPGIPDGLEVLELLAKAAGERPPSAEVVAARLRSLSQRLAAAPPTPSCSPSGWRRYRLPAVKRATSARRDLPGPPEPWGPARC